MPKLRASTTTTDTIRAVRVLIAWLDGDKLALDVVLEEVMGDPTGTPGLVFELADIAVFLGLKADPDLGVFLRGYLLDQQDKNA